MRFFVNGRQERPTNSGPYPFVVLQTDNWDDYGFKTTFHPVVYLSEGEPIDLETVKILKLGQEGGPTPIDAAFEELDESYCSLGQDRSYYERLRALTYEERHAYLVGLRDVAAIPLVRKRFETENGFGVSLVRDGAAKRALDDASSILSGEDVPGAPETQNEDGSERQSESATERRLDDAMDLIGATTSNDIKIRAIEQARGVLVEWTDYDDERRLFAAVIDVGLLELEAFVRDKRPAQSPETILANLRRNIDHAIDWANENRYPRFAGTLTAILSLLAKFVT